MKVKSLKQARDFLTSKGLTESSDNHAIVINPDKTLGILFKFSDLPSHRQAQGREENAIGRE